MTMILGMNTPDIQKKKNSGSSDATQTLNFGNISKPVSFNDGNSEGYYKVRPKALLPSKHNPRPDWIIDDAWLVRHVGIDMEDIFEGNQNSLCLVKLIEEEDVDGKHIEHAIYPEFEALVNNPDIAQKKEYEFLLSLAKSIRDIGQIQPIEIESDFENNALVVLEGHLRRLACILGRVPYIKAIRNEGLHDLGKRKKIERQITENSLRHNISVYGNYKLACEELKEDKKITVRDLVAKLRISRDLASALIKLISLPEKFHPAIGDVLAKGLLSANNLIKVVALKRMDRQEQFLAKFLQNALPSNINQENTLARGKDGRKKTVATLQIKTADNCIRAGNKLLQCLPDLQKQANMTEVHSVEDMERLLKSFEAFLLENNVGESHVFG